MKDRHQYVFDTIIPNYLTNNCLSWNLHDINKLICVNKNWRDVISDIKSKYPKYIIPKQDDKYILNVEKLTILYQLLKIKKITFDNLILHVYDIEFKKCCNINLLYTASVTFKCFNQIKYDKFHKKIIILFSLFCCFEKYKWIHIKTDVKLKNIFLQKLQFLITYVQLNLSKNESYRITTLISNWIKKIK